MSLNNLEYFEIISDILYPLKEKIYDERRKELKKGYLKIYTADYRRLLNKLTKKEYAEIKLQLWENIRDYWKKNLDNTLKDIRKDNKMKAFYLRPDVHRPPELWNIVRRIALYVDKIIIVDPIRYVQVINSKDKLELHTKFSVLDAFYLPAMKEWVENDIVTFLPQPELWNKDICKDLMDLIEKDMHEIVKDIKIVEIPEDIKIHQILSTIRKKEDIFTYREPSKEEEHQSHLYLSQRLSSTLNSTLLGSEALNANPTTDWGEDFSYWEWKNKFDGKKLNYDTKILYSLNKYPLKWFNNIPLELLLELREKDILNETRILFREKFNEIRNVKSEELEDVVKYCHDIFNIELEKTNILWKNIQKEVLRKVTISTFASLVTGIISAFASSSLNISSLYGALLASGATFSTLGINQITDLFNKRRELQNNPSYLLFHEKGEAKLDYTSIGEVGTSFGWSIPLECDYKKNKIIFEEKYLEKLRNKLKKMKS